MGTASGRPAEEFDRWYADMTASPVKDEIQQRCLGLPPHLLSTSLLGWDGVAEVTAALRLSPGQTLVDLACGRGGYGLEIAARTGARLVGVDFSAEAVRQARDNARTMGATAEFRVGDLAGTGLQAGSADAVLCVDAIQFAQQPGAAYREIARLLKSGGRAVLTCWEPLNWDDEQLPERLRQVDLRAGLAGAAFTGIEVAHRPGWRDAERAMWEQAAALDPGDDPALCSFHDEGVRVLKTFDLARRVMATATWEELRLLRAGGFDYQEHGVLGYGGAWLRAEIAHYAGGGGGEEVLHLYRLDHDVTLAGGDGLAVGHLGQRHGARHGARPPARPTRRRPAR